MNFFRGVGGGGTLAAVTETKASLDSIVHLENRCLIWEISTIEYFVFNKFPINKMVPKQGA